VAVDSIHWLTLGDADRARLRDAVATTLATRSWAQAAWLYGSVARKQPARDIDVGLVADPLPPDGDLSVVADEIAARFGVSSAVLDLRLLNGGDPVFLGNVMRDGMLLFERDREARIRFEVYALNQWLDFRPVWERLRKRVLERWAHG